MKTIVLIVAVLASIIGGNPAKMAKDKAQMATLETLRDVSGDGQLYSMNYKADYFLQDFIDANLNSQGMVSAAAGKILFGMGKTKAGGEPMNPACSAFQAVTPDGDVIYGRNFDYRFKDGASIMMRTSAKGAYKSLSMVSMSFIGYEGKQFKDGKTDLSMLLAAPLVQMDGMNEKGLAVSVLVVVANDCARQYDKSKKTIMTSVMMRMLLDRAASVDEALEMLTHYNFFCDGEQKDRKPGNKSNYHFLLSDKSGRTVVLEYIKKEGPDSDSEWVMNPVDEKVATNHFRSEGWKHLGRQDERFNKMTSVLEQEGGVLTEDEAMKLLCDVHQEAHEGHEGKTQWSVVYNLTKGTAKVCMNHDYSRTFEFAIKNPRKYFK